jgi:hypothetical protein
MLDTVSADSVKAQMPHPTLTHIKGELTHKQVKVVLRELTTNLMAVSCPWGHEKGHVGLLQDPAIYLARNEALFDIPAAKPPAYPVVSAGATAPQREELRATNAATCKARTPFSLVLSITRDQFTATINDVYYAVLDNPIKGLNGVDLRTLVTHILTTYAQISQPNLDDNLMEFNTSIDPILPLAVYTRNQEKCQVFANNAGAPISNTTMVTTGTKQALATRNMTLAWREWKRHPIANHTWPNWKVHWTAAFAEMHDINCMMAGESAFGANAMEEEEQVHQIASSLNNLANASIQKNLTIDSLVGTNAQLMQVLADIQIAMVCMIPPGKPHHTRVQPQRGGPILCLPRPHQRHLPLQWRVSSVSALPTGALSSQTGQGGLLLDAQLQGEGQAHQYHVLVPLHLPSTGHDMGQHHGQE